MTTTNKTPRITKAMRYADVKAMLMGEVPANGTDLDTAIEFISHEMELLAAKNSSKSGKQTTAQKENEEYRALILDFLSTQSEGVTCTEIAKGIPALSDFQNQKISALMRSLTYHEEKNPAGMVDKSIVKGKALFTLR